MPTSAVQTPFRFGFASHSACRECGQTDQLGARHACSRCFGPLEVGCDLPPLRREQIEAAPPNIWRYASLLPVPPEVAQTRTPSLAGPG